MMVATAVLAAIGWLAASELVPWPMLLAGIALL